uniref:Uncharacterized protein n=1 Tax=Leptobrachium leishanense TaxID=445787 RepID=A0A8C5LWR2_9ANUR
MVRGKGKLNTPKTPAHRATRRTGPLDTFITTVPPGSPHEETAKMADAPPSPAHAPDSMEAIRRLERMISALPTKTDLSDIIADLREGFGREVREVRVDMEALSSRVGLLEETARHPLQPAQTHTRDEFSDLQRRVDDLDNRGRRHNIRVRGLAETDDPEDLRTTLRELFNLILNRDTDAPVPMDRGHRALRPRPPSTAPPRDIICHLVDYSLKEEIMKRARTSQHWDYHGHRLELFHDLSPFTLAARRCLLPVTQALRQAGIQYRWGFPFALSVERNGIRHVIQRPADVRDFLHEMDLPGMNVRDWESDQRKDGPAPSSQRRPRRPRRRQRPSPVHDPAVEDPME